eukprot:3835551-Pleurochrysis_carterae.AAC.1
MSLSGNKRPRSEDQVAKQIVSLCNAYDALKRTDLTLPKNIKSHFDRRVKYHYSKLLEIELTPQWSALEIAHD